MEGTISPIPGWATRYRDRVEVELADIELFESWPDGPAAGEELARWGRAMVGRCNLGTAIYLIFVAAGPGSRVGIASVDPRQREPQPGMLMLSLPSEEVIPVSRFRFLTTED